MAWPRVLRSPHDRRIFALAVPALGALAAEPLYILVDTATSRTAPATRASLMWGMLAAAAVYVPVALLALDRGWGIRGVWRGLAGLIAVRLATCAARFAGSRWALTGATARS